MNACAHAAVPKASRPRTSPRRPEQAVGEGRIYNKERKIIISTFFEIQSYVISMNFEIMKSARHSAPVPPRPSPARRPFGAVFRRDQSESGRDEARGVSAAPRSAPFVPLRPRSGGASACADRAKPRARLPRGRAAAEPAELPSPQKSKSSRRSKSYRAWRSYHRSKSYRKGKIMPCGGNHIEENHITRGESCCK